MDDRLRMAGIERLAGGIRKEAKAPNRVKRAGFQEQASNLVNYFSPLIPAFPSPYAPSLYTVSKVTGRPIIPASSDGNAKVVHDPDQNVIDNAISAGGHAFGGLVSGAASGLKDLAGLGVGALGGVAGLFNGQGVVNSAINAGSAANRWAGRNLGLDAIETAGDYVSQKARDRYMATNGISDNPAERGFWDGGAMTGLDLANGAGKGVGSMYAWGALNTPAMAGKAVAAAKSQGVAPMLGRGAKALARTPYNDLKGGSGMVWSTVSHPVQTVNGAYRHIRHPFASLKGTPWEKTKTVGYTAGSMLFGGMNAYDGIDAGSRYDKSRHDASTRYSENAAARRHTLRTPATQPQGTMPMEDVNSAMYRMY